MTVTCQGACCAVFFQPAGRHLEADTGDRDHDFITDMLVPLEAGEANARARRFGMKLAERIQDDWSGTAGTFYTCRHFDGRLCTVYADRPGMCSDYPYDGTCSHGCSYQASEETREKWRYWRRVWALEAWRTARQGAA